MEYRELVPYLLGSVVINVSNAYLLSLSGSRNPQGAFGHHIPEKPAVLGARIWPELWGPDHTTDPSSCRIRQ